MFLSLWQQCLIKLQAELSTNEFSRWIRPLQVELNDNELLIYAPNRCVLDWVRDKYLNSISLFLDNFCGSSAPLLRFKVGIKPLKVDILQKNNSHILENSISDSSLFNIGSSYVKCNTLEIQSKLFYSSNVNPKLNFNNFIEGKSNRLARNIAMQVSESPGKIYNPVFLYSSTGLGKTHLLHAVGNNIIDRKHNVKIVYISSESFVKNMVQALQNNVIEQFKLYYRSVDVFLIDDIEFFGNKERSQEEFFHTFNSLLEGNQQIVISANCCPKEIRGVDNRLKSRFSWGLTISIKHPDLDTCVAILMKKAEENAISLPKEVDHFIAKNINSNVRELEGALNLVMANSILFGKEITLEFVREVLKDVLIFKKKLVAINNIKQTVAEFYKIKVTDLLSKKRSRSISIPRQIAMALSKKLSNCSFLEIGREFGGRDHTTVLHACRKIDHLREEDSDFEEDFLNLIKVLLS